MALGTGPVAVGAAPVEVKVELAELSHLEAVFKRAVELRLSDDEAVGRMMENVRKGNFSAQHYADMWRPRIEEAERTSGDA